MAHNSSVYEKDEERQYGNLVEVYIYIYNMVKMITKIARKDKHGIGIMMEEEKSGVSTNTKTCEWESSATLRSTNVGPVEHPILFFSWEGGRKRQTSDDRHVL